MKPRLLDLFCGAGGCSTGYARAGFEVEGIDLAPQPNYPFPFMQADALDFLREVEPGDFDAIAASPPCQHYAGVTAWRGDQSSHPDLVGPTRELLEQTGLPWVMENVREAPVRADFMLCGTALGLKVRRHRHFETNWSGMVMGHPCRHHPDDFSFDHGAKQPETVYREAMGCDWMTVKESRNAIPPAYTEVIGSRLMEVVMARA